jgi:hypothetical protein
MIAKEDDMDVRPEQLIDMGLTAAGLLAAGGFCAAVYSIFRRRRALTPRIVAAAPTATELSSKLVSKRRDDIEFISFGPSASPATEAPVAEPRRVEQSRRNRAEIIRQARQMLERGATNRDITRSLAMSEGEVALLRQDINRS